MKDRKERDSAYKAKMKEKGYGRINKWCPVRDRKMINSILDLLACHYESPDSTVDWHECIDLMKQWAEQLDEDYSVRDDNVIKFKGESND